MKSKRRRQVGILFSMVMAFFLAIPSGFSVARPAMAGPERTNPDELQQAFISASKEFGVPLSVLMSVSYNESRWNQHNGEPSMSGGYGVMHLTHVDQVPDVQAKGDGAALTMRSVANDQSMHTLDTAAQLIGEQPKTLKQDPAQNIRGGAALLAKYERETFGKLSSDPADWYGAVAKYSGSKLEGMASDFADQVFTTIGQGATLETPSGQIVNLSAQSIKPNKNTTKALHLKENKKGNDVDCPNGLDCEWIPAAYQKFSNNDTDYGNYDLANRPKDDLDIKYIIIHDIEGTYQEGVNTFLGQSYVSAHYVVRETDGHIAEMVKPKDVAWQAGNWYVNTHSIGIEHGGTAVEGASWFSEPMYHASARLVKYLAHKYDIPLDRQHILGHDNVSGLSPSSQSGMHWDPATYWDWGHFFEILGAPFHNKGKKHSDVVTINPNFHKNKPPVSYNGEPLPKQSANFVYLYTEPRFDAPLVSDPAMHPDGSPGTTAINDWGDKAVTGQSFYKAGEKGDWTAIYYAGQKAWFYNPHGKNAVRSEGLLIKPRKGLAVIPVYGSPMPEASAYDGTGVPVQAIHPLQYTIPAGQIYVATKPTKSDYYYAKLFNAPSTYKIIKGRDEYYQISFNHRIAFVKKSDVDVVK